MASLASLLTIAQVVLGIGLVIFVHELGHYIAARLCGVRVETFSLGFGPRLFGWKRGDTVYQVAAVPLGGYCRMAGEEARSAGRAPEEDELSAKSVPQRFFIYSGGVLMNVAFGLVVFPILFWIGVPFLEPSVRVLEGGAAWKAGVPDHSRVLEVNGRTIHEFVNIPTEVALGDPQRTVLKVLPPGASQPRVFEVVPEKDEREGIRRIDVRFEFERDDQGRPVIDVVPGSPASEAGLKGGERLAAVLDGIPGLDLAEQLTLQGTGAAPLRLRVVDDAGEREVTIPPRELDQKHPPRVGIAPARNRVHALRANPVVRELGLLVDDRLEEVTGRPVVQLGDLRRALLESEGELRFRVRREGVERELVAPALTDAEKLALADAIALRQDGEATLIATQPGGPAELAGIRSGDRIVAIDDAPVSVWDDIPLHVEAATKADRPAIFQVARPGPEGPEILQVAVQPEARPVATYGLSLRQAQYVYRSDGVLDAVGFGMVSSWNILRQSYMTLKRMLFNDVSPRNVGGIITIGAVSYSLAETGWTKLAFFLCLLSINLAFINVLPIPVLDGGHMAFLLIEGVKGSPVSKRTLDYSQMVGVVMILTLMVYVTYNDLVRWVFPN